MGRRIQTYNVYCCSKNMQFDPWSDFNQGRVVENFLQSMYSNHGLNVYPRDYCLRNKGLYVKTRYPPQLQHKAFWRFKTHHPQDVTILKETFVCLQCWWSESSTGFLIHQYIVWRNSQLMQDLTKMMLLGTNNLPCKCKPLDWFQ